ncbi:MAG: penicillin-binding protein 2 [Holosporales bacterium]|nr:penicillin-binding protein 2 [Holosporales bacterium]
MLRKMFSSLFDGFVMWRNSKNHAELIAHLRARMVFSSICGTVVFSCISYRLVDVMIISHYRTQDSNATHTEYAERKADIVDRNGELIATSVTTASCFADPSAMIDVDEAVMKLSKIPGMPSPEKLKLKMSDKSKHFVWLTRHVSPQVHEQIMDLGIPGIHFQKDYKRIYIHGNLFSHVVGCSDIDGDGVCGLEKHFAKELAAYGNLNKYLVTTLDLRLQAIVHEELSDAVARFKAAGGNAMLMSHTGEILAMVSLPDFDPNNLKNCSSSAMFNRNTLGVFEPGSVLKIVNVAIALDSGAASLGSIFDASEPLKIGRFSVTDFKGKRRPLTLAEAFVFSSNIASAKIEQSFGATVQKAYMRRLGLLDKVSLEIPEVGSPIVPRLWNETAATTMSYGYGIAMTPLMLLAAVASILNDGIRVAPTLVYGKRKINQDGERVVSCKTSRVVRDLMRAAVFCGTARKSAVEGAEIIGKTGTSYQAHGRGGYGADGSRKRNTTFIGGFPKDTPQFMLIVSLDDPKATEESHMCTTAGHNAAPTAKNIFKRIVPLLYDTNHETDDSNLTVLKYIKLDG